MKRHVPLCLLLASFLPGCAHNYFYRPEIKGQGEMKGPKAQIVYAIPAQGQAELSMQVLSLGIKKNKDAELLGIRLTFSHPDGSDALSKGAREYLDPLEQVIHFGEAEFKPVYVRARKRSANMVDISASHEVVELLYPIPAGSKGPGDVVTFSLHWKVHYGKSAMEAQATKFDRVDKAPQQAGSAFSDDPNYPWDINTYGLPAWDLDGQPFWSPFPFGMIP